MDDAIRSILCEPECWTWEPFLNYHLKFNSDGSGELFCIQELSYLCALNFTWKISSLSEAADTPTKAQSLGTIRLEITLQNDLAKSLQTSDPAACLRMHERYLLDTAYRPKTFIATLEKGNFIPAARKGYEEKESMLRYGLRLLFDRSPFPAYEDWNTKFPNDVPPVGPADREQTPMTEFVARELPKKECKGTAMNDEASAKAWGSCVVS